MCFRCARRAWTSVTRMKRPRRQRVLTKRLPGSRTSFSTVSYLRLCMVHNAKYVLSPTISRCWKSIASNFFAVFEIFACPAYLKVIFFIDLFWFLSFEDLTAVKMSVVVFWTSGTMLQVRTTSRSRGLPPSRCVCLCTPQRSGVYPHRN